MPVTALLALGGLGWIAVAGTSTEPPRVRGRSG
jgi:hypothetical protein